MQDGDRDPITGVLKSQRERTEREIERSPAGGLNSKISGRYDLIDPRFLRRLAAVLEYGATQYTPHNWRLDPPELHLSHLQEHLENWKESRWDSEVSTGEREIVPWLENGREDELGHAAARLMFLMITEMQTSEEVEYVRRVEGVEK